MNILSKKRQRGAETLEFLVVFPLFMLLLMTVFEAARILYVWNALAEATRRGARMAIVCPIDATSQTIVRNVAVFDTIGGALGTSPVVNGLTPADITITYRNEAGAVEATPMNIKFAQVEINNGFQFQFQPLLSGLVPGLTLNTPAFRATLYMESLGAVPTYPGEAQIAPTCNF